MREGRMYLGVDPQKHSGDHLSFFSQPIPVKNRKSELVILSNFEIWNPQTILLFAFKKSLENKK